MYVIVVGYRNEDAIISCAAEVLNSSYPNVFVIGINNGGLGIKSITRLGERFELHGSGSNLGFAGACNLGAGIALSRGANYILLLNDDALPSRECVERMVLEMERNPGIGLMCPIFVSSSTGVVETVGGWYNNWIGLSLFGYVNAKLDEIPSARFRTGYGSGAALMLNADALRKVGGLDERYFMYVEDLDMSIRMRKAGYSVSCLPEAFVRHTSSSTSSRDPGLKQYYMMRNRFILCWLMKTKVLLITVAFSTPWIMLLRCLKDLRHRDAQELKGLFYGMIDGLNLQMGPSRRRAYAPL